MTDQNKKYSISDTFNMDCDIPTNSCPLKNKLQREILGLDKINAETLNFSFSTFRALHKIFHNYWNQHCEMLCQNCETCLFGRKDLREQLNEFRSGLEIT